MKSTWIKKDPTFFLGQNVHMHICVRVTVWALNQQLELEKYLTLHKETDMRKKSFNQEKELDDKAGARRHCSPTNCICDSIFIQSYDQINPIWSWRVLEIKNKLLTPNIVHI